MRVIGPSWRRTNSALAIPSPRVLEAIANIRKHSAMSLAEAVSLPSFHASIHARIADRDRVGSPRRSKVLISFGPISDPATRQVRTEDRKQSASLKGGPWFGQTIAQQQTIAL